MRPLFVGLLLIATGCPSDPEMPSTGTETSTGEASTSGSSSGEASTAGSSSSGDPGDDTTQGTIDCDPPCDPATEECIDGVCMPLPPTSDYGPCDACDPVEVPVAVPGVDGFCVCAPLCEGTRMTCPGPTEGTAEPLCVLALEEGGDPTLCALRCEGDEQCPRGATCEDIGGGSICMHPSVM